MRLRRYTVRHHRLYVVERPIQRRFKKINGRFVEMSPLRHRCPICGQWMPVKRGAHVKLCRKIERGEAY